MNAQNDDEADIAATLEAIKFAWKKKPSNPAEFARWIKVAIRPGCSVHAVHILERTADMLKDELEAGR